LDLTRALRRYPLRVFVGFFDESGLDERSKSFWVGGYLAHMSTWFEFARAWQRALQRAGVSHFHMTDFENRQKQFRGWPDKARLSLIDELVSIIASNELYGFGGGVVRGDYQKLIVQSQFLDSTQLTKHWWTEPYMLAFQHCIVEAVLEADSLPATECMSFVFDRQKAFAARLRIAIEQMATDIGWARRNRLGSITFESKADRSPLQAADLLVFELRKELDNRIVGAERPLRKSLKRLRPQLKACRFFDERGLRQFMGEVQQKDRISAITRHPTGSASTPLEQRGTFQGD
jgi:hypothetical protein